MNQSYYLLTITNREILYDEVQALISSDFYSQSSRIRILFRRFPTLFEALGWCKKKESKAPILLCVIDFESEIISTMANGNLIHIHKAFQRYTTEIAYLVEGSEYETVYDLSQNRFLTGTLSDWTSRICQLSIAGLHAHLLNKKSSKQWSERICQILSGLISQRSNGGVSNKEIYELLIDQKSSGLPKKSTLSANEMMELGHRLKLLEQRGQTAIDRIESEIKNNGDDYDEMRKRIDVLNADLQRIDDTLFRQDFHTGDQSIAGQIWMMNSRITKIVTDLKNYSTDLKALEGDLQKLQSVDAKDEKDFSQTPTQVAITLLTHKIYAPIFGVLMIISVLYFVFNVSVESMFDAIIRYKEGPSQKPGFEKILIDPDE